MRHIRLYVNLPLHENHELALPRETAGHAIRVLRLKNGDKLTLFNGDGHDYAGEILQAGRHEALVRTGTRQAVPVEPAWPLVLGQCLARGDKMDLVVQKATELGVTRIVPLTSERSEVRLDPARAQKRQRHWQAVAISACEQCGRARVPDIAEPQKLDTWLGRLDDDGALRLALLPDANKRVRDLVMPDTGAILAIGPEGGLGDRDTQRLTEAGFSGLALGPRILRTETAGLAALAAIHACHGDF